MTRRQLTTKRYYWHNNAHCPACGRAVRFYTTPFGIRVLDPMPKDDSPVIEHRKVCKGEKAHGVHR